MVSGEHVRHRITKPSPNVAAALACGSRPSRELEYDELVELLDQLTDQVGEDESHPLASLMDVLGVLIEKHEDEPVAELSA